MNINFATQNKQQYTHHPYHLPYSPQCICMGCNQKPYHDGKTYYSLCLGCLEKKSLGPFKVRHHKEEEYSTLFWLTDYERKVYDKMKGTTK